MKIYKIYCLKNEEGKITYIGQTSRTLRERLSEHRKNLNIEENIQYIYWRKLLILKMPMS